MTAAVLGQPAIAASSALLQISDLRLLLPQKEICALESAASVEMHDAQAPSIGWFQHEQQRWPVYCLSQGLSLLATIPAERRACVLLRVSAGYLGILCDDVSIAQQAQGKQLELPVAMRLPDIPVLGLVILNQDNIACLTSAERLVAYVANQVES